MSVPKRNEQKIKKLTSYQDTSICFGKTEDAEAKIEVRIINATPRLRFF
jgi:hypothetical protein